MIYDRVYDAVIGANLTSCLFMFTSGSYGAAVFNLSAVIFMLVVYTPHQGGAK